MKRIFFFIFMLICISKADAQILKELKSSTPERRALLFSKEIKKHLELNEKQFKQVLEINQMHAFGIIPVIESKKNKIAKLKKIKALDRQRDEKLKYIFTQEQQLVYKNKKRTFIKTVRDSLNTSPGHI